MSLTPTPLQMFQEVLNDRNQLLTECSTLRAELERVTAERDAARKYHTVEYEQRREAERELAETKAARAQDRERDTRTMQDLLDINSETLDATYRELAEARAALADCADRVHPDEHAAALAELDQLRRAWALRELAEPELLTDGALTYFPESVAALIRSGAGCPMGACVRCKQRAPLKDKGTQGFLGFCAPGWPCKGEP